MYSMLWMVRINIVVVDVRAWSQNSPVLKGLEILSADVDGKLTGGDAVKFFERSGLPRELLAKVGEAAPCPV